MKHLLNVGGRECPLYPRKRTCAAHRDMSAKGQKADIGATAGVQERDAATRGKVTLISVNSPGCVSTSIEPPCCFTMMS
jgi:hypothetical protein